MSTPDDQLGDLQSTLDAQRATAADAQTQLQSTVSGFNPPEGQPGAFSGVPPEDHWNDVVKVSPLIMALGAVGGAFGKAHGIAMLQSTNAMMKGMVTGSAEQYADARQQYETKYDQWKDQNKTWNDTYKAYLTAYKDRVDAQQRAVAGANAAVGITEREMNRSQQSVLAQQKLSAQIEDIHNKIKARDSKEVTDRIKADTAQARAETAAKEADLRVEQIKNQTKTADTNTLAATARSLKSEADTILKEYPASAGKRPPEVEAKLKGIRDSMDVVNEKMSEHTQADYNKNKATYEDARKAIAAGVPKDIIARRLADQGLDPGQL